MSAESTEHAISAEAIEEQDEALSAVQDAGQDTDSGTEGSEDQGTSASRLEEADISLGPSHRHRSSQG